MSAALATARFESPVGIISVTADDTHLQGVRIGDDDETTGPNRPLLDEAINQLRAWFVGSLHVFDLPLSPAATPEGARLRAAIADIRYGETQTYGAVAARTGTIAQAVGQACKTNPFPLIIPCHRVVSTAGPEYYSAGDGPRTKSWLLDFEYSHLPPDRRTRLL